MTDLQIEQTRAALRRYRAGTPAARTELDDLVDAEIHSVLPPAEIATMVRERNATAAGTGPRLQIRDPERIPVRNP